MKTGAAQLIVGLLMLGSAAMAILLKPMERLASDGPRVHLATMIPKSFHGWHTEPGQTAILINPQLSQKVDRLYDQTLSRTYRNGAGDSIMLSIAYGGNQADQSLQVHRPEFCYRSQGFHILRSTSGTITTPWRPLPVRRLVATRGPRHEPITYWITVGDEATLPGFGRKLEQLRYGLTGHIPDGMLIRISSIDPDDAKAYRQQRDFIISMLTAVAAGNPTLARRRLAHLGVL